MITALPCHDLKPGKAQKPFFGVQPALVDNEGNILEGEAEGNFVILDSWPGQMRSIYGDHERFIQTYFSTFPGKYFTGDGASRDADGDYRITGRVDDVINVSGHRLGTAEIEDAINEHESVAESAVVGYPHDIKGQGIYAYVTLNSGEEGDDASGAFEVRGQFEGKAVRMCRQCGTGLFVGLFSGVLLGRPRVIPPRREVWERLCLLRLSGTKTLSLVM